MKRLLLLLFLVATIALGLVIQATAGPNGTNLLAFDRMAPVVPPFTGTTNPIRAINGGGVPWALTSAEGQLRLTAGPGSRSWASSFRLGA